MIRQTRCPLWVDGTTIVGTAGRLPLRVELGDAAAPPQGCAISHELKPRDTSLTFAAQLPSLPEPAGIQSSSLHSTPLERSQQQF
eukprot:m.326137 g.326137  ORF g.326137 m.326137 type:complete len:85 (+) comp16476_c1_seq5:1068-1322(+)